VQRGWGVGTLLSADSSVPQDSGEVLIDGRIPVANSQQILSLKLSPAGVGDRG